jgi:nitrite reductase/ring-hydroxylating ferredoxin subunit
MPYKVCNNNDLKENNMFKLSINNCRRRRGRLFACNNSCPHRGASLSKGDLRGDNIVCYMHGYEFNLFTGNLEHLSPGKKTRNGWTKRRMEKIR